MGLLKGKKLIIFDFDGTLHDLNVDWGEIRHALSIDDSGESLGDALERFKLQGDQKMLETMSSYEKEALAGDSLDEGVKQVLVDLQKQYEVAIFSRNSSKVIRDFMQKNGVFVEQIIGREDVLHLKPSTEGLEKIMRRYSRDRKETVLIGDTWHDLLVAQKAGIDSVIVGNNFKHDSITPKYKVSRIQDVSSLF